nr:hypothetical protein BaRGS_004698 [Batillaria attramentaria]
MSKSSQALVCPYCLSDSFDTLEVLELHMQSVHSVKSSEIYTCNYCNAPYPNLCSQTFSDARQLEDHMVCVHGASVEKKSAKQRGRKSASKGNKENKASSSKNKTSTATRVSATTSGHPGLLHAQPQPRSHACPPRRKGITCDQCNATFHELGNFQAHMKLHLDAALAKFTCKKCCMKLFSKPDELQKHLMDHPCTPPVQVSREGKDGWLSGLGCALCKEIFDSKVNIQVHFAIKHSNECKLFKCTQCSNIFRSEMEWQAFHIEYLRTSTCRLNTLTWTQKSATLNTSTSPALASISSDTLKSLSPAILSLQPPAVGRGRVKNTDSSATMSCAFCSQTFRNQVECDKHMKIHANSTSLKCNICDETFPSSATLAEHKLQHCKIQQGNICFGV